MKLHAASETGWGIAWIHPHGEPEGEPLLWWEFFGCRSSAHRYAEKSLGQPWRQLYRQGLRVVKARLAVVR